MARIWRALCYINIHPWKRSTNDRTGRSVYRCRGCGVAGVSCG